MDRFLIRGGRPLHGEIRIGGAKNSALKLLVAGLLTSERIVLSNVPRIDDIGTMRLLLEQHGLCVDAVEEPAGNTGGFGQTLSVGGEITNTEAPYDIVSKMRASILVLGPLLARAGEARVSLPGGCAIGTRPVDLHLKGLEALGAEIRLEGGYIDARAPRGLVGARIVLPFASVGATENLLMAATLASGRTEIVNAAREPEIGDLISCLVAMGAAISDQGAGTLVIDGVPRLHGVRHAVVSDRIECGTYACAVAIAGGDVRLLGGEVGHLGAVVRVLEEAGIAVTQEDGAMRVRRTGRLAGVDVMTEPYPGFPTDMQAQFMALFSVADGASMMTETIFENRFMHVPELNRMGARINVHGASAIIRGVPSLSGAPVMATDLRASFSLILAGLAAGGETVLSRVYHLDRGYEAVERKLSGCGAVIERLRS